MNPVGEWSPLLGDFRGVVRYERTFHRPTGLDGGPVTLVVEGVSWRATVQLNEEPLGELVGRQSLRIDVRERLQVRNRLQLEIEFPAGMPSEIAPPPAGLLGGTRLEIG